MQEGSEYAPTQAEVTKTTSVDRLKGSVRSGFTKLSERIIGRLHRNQPINEGSVLAPPIPESAVRQEFKLVEWNGFALSQAEAASVERFMANESAKRKYAELYLHGNNIRDADGSVRPDAIDTAVAAVRSDGILFFLDSLQHGSLQISDKSEKSTRYKGQGKGVFMTKLVDIDVDKKGFVTNVSRVSEEMRAKRIVDSTGVYTSSSAMEVSNATLFPEARNEFWHQMIDYTLKKDGNLDGYNHLFQYEGEEFVAYLNRAVRERSSIVWGLSPNALSSGEYSFGFGDFGNGDSDLAEIDVRAKNGVQIDDMAFIAARPGSLEDEIGKQCLSSLGISELSTSDS